MAAPTSDTAPLEFKGRMLSLSILRIASKDLDGLATALDAQLSKARGLLEQMPVVLDFAVNEIDVDSLLGILRERGLTVLAAFRCAASLEQRARNAGLAVIRPPGGERSAGDTPASSVQPEAEAEAEAEIEDAAPAVARSAAHSRIITTPVRSGQQIYARGDLTLLAPVSAGAEVIADGSLHIYASLRGRAVAGAQGDEAARIFCRDLQAELLAVAGRYKVAEDIPEAVRGKAVQVYLDGDRMCIESIN